MAIFGESYGRCTVDVEHHSMKDVSSSDIIVRRFKSDVAAKGVSTKKLQIISQRGHNQLAMLYPP